VKVYLGYEEREREACRVAEQTLRATSGIEPQWLVADRLRESGLFTRAVDKRGGQAYDLTSNANCSTDFANSRFLVPILCQHGWALFADCDMVFHRDVHELLAVADPAKAVAVVKHDHQPTTAVKMDGQQQVAYGRKNWSSLILWNVDHPANRRLTLWDVNNRRGIDLHQFFWLADDEIGDLPPEWNWLVGEQPRPERLAVSHFTRGGPFTPGWPGAEHDDIWLQAARAAETPQ
jgi:lipopolysaccharide biosynthesis glycosyltransferase